MKYFTDHHLFPVRTSPDSRSTHPSIIFHDYNEIFLLNIFPLNELLACVVNSWLRRILKRLFCYKILHVVLIAYIAPSNSQNMKLMVFFLRIELMRLLTDCSWFQLTSLEV